jgi:hypothetical protein
MVTLVHERAVSLIDPDGRLYDHAYVFTEPGRVTWSGWIEFVAEDGSKVLRTDQETSQSNLEGVAYWATGLEPSYFEGAFARAWRQTQGRGEPTLATSPATGGGAVRLTVETVDPGVPLTVMATRTLVPGLRRRVHNGGVLVYEGAHPGDSGTAYEFVAQYGSDNAAAVLANTLWSDLHGVGASVFIEDVPVPLNHSALKEALLVGHVA